MSFKAVTSALIGTLVQKETLYLFLYKGLSKRGLDYFLKHESFTSQAN